MELIKNQELDTQLWNWLVHQIWGEHTLNYIIKEDMTVFRAKRLFSYDRSYAIW